MFSLFTPLDVAIEKKLPQQARLEYLSVLAFVDSTCAARNHKKLSIMRGIVGSVWAYCSTLTGKLTLPKADCEFIRGLGGKYTLLLNAEEVAECERAIAALKRKGVIP